MTTTNIVDAARVELLLNELRLPSIRLMWAKLAEQSDKEGWPAARFLAVLAEHEMADRGRRRFERHLTEARLPAGKTLATFDFEAVPMVSKAQVMALASGDAWLEKGANILLFGPPGGGKSHLSAALGLALVENGWRVLFTRTTDLVQQLQVARRDLTLESAITKLDRYDLLILDDLAYVTKDQAETSVLFELIAARYERRSMLITANQPFGEWGKIFPDQAMTLAAIDRLVHHATILEMNVDSYRRKEAVDKARGVGRPPTRATIKASSWLSLHDNQTHGHANIACVIVAPRQSSSRRDRRNGHPDCRCVPIQIVALQIEEFGLPGYHLDPDSLFPAIRDVHDFELAALDTLQHGLARDTELAGCLVHGHEAVPSSLAESGDEVIGQANAPGCAGRQLLARNDAVVEPAVQSRRGDAEHDRGLLDRRQFALGGGRPGLEARDVPVATQIADTARLEAMAVYRGAPLAIEDAGNHGVWIMQGQPADECDRVLIGAYRGRPRAWQREIDLVERAALPAQREVGCSLVALDLYDDLLEQCSQQLFPVTRRGRCRVPDGGKIGPEREQTVALLLGEHAWTLQFAACKLGLGGFEGAQALLQLTLQAASDQPVVWIDGTVAALGAARFVACPLDAETPLLERGLAICFEPLGSGERGSELCRLEGGDEGPRDGLVDLNAANVEAIDAAALDQDLAGAMIPRCRTAPAIVRVQAASAVPAAGKPLQQGAAWR